MLDLFTIFSKGGIVLWCFQSTTQLFTPSVNALIKNVILQVGLFLSELKVYIKRNCFFRKEQVTPLTIKMGYNCNINWITNSI